MGSRPVTLHVDGLDLRTGPHGGREWLESLLGTDGVDLSGVKLRSLDPKGRRWVRNFVGPLEFPSLLSYLSTLPNEQTRPLPEDCSGSGKCSYGVEVIGLQRRNRESWRVSVRVRGFRSELGSETKVFKNILQKRPFRTSLTRSEWAIVESFLSRQFNHLLNGSGLPYFEYPSIEFF